jgi:hypothetical protein
MHQLFNSQSKSTSKKPKESAVVEENEDDDDEEEEEIQVHSIKPASLMKLLFSDHSDSCQAEKQAKKENECIGHFEKLDDTIHEEDLAKPLTEETSKTLSIEVVKSVEMQSNEQTEVSTNDDSNQTDDMKSEMAAVSCEKVESSVATVEAAKPIITIEPETVTEETVPVEAQAVETIAIPETVKETVVATKSILEEFQEETCEQPHVIINIPDEETATVTAQDEVQELVSRDQVVETVVETSVHTISEEVINTETVENVQTADQQTEVDVVEEQQEASEPVVNSVEVVEEVQQASNTVVDQVETVESNNEKVEEPIDMSRIFKFNY